MQVEIRLELATVKLSQGTSELVSQVDRKFYGSDPMEVSEEDVAAWHATPKKKDHTLNVSEITNVRALFVACMFLCCNASLCTYCSLLFGDLNLF